MSVQSSAAQLATAFLFGGSLLYSSAFAAFLFRELPADRAGALLRRAFAAYYLWVMGTALLAAVLFLGIDTTSGLVLAAIALTTVPVRQKLMPAINRASDSVGKARFHRRHGLSVGIGVLQILAAGYVVLRAA